MHMWVIYVGRHLSRTLKKSNAPAEDRTGDPSIYSLALYHVPIKAGLYRKAVQVYYIPNLYPVTGVKGINIKSENVSSYFIQTLVVRPQV